VKLPCKIANTASLFFVHDFVLVDSFKTTKQYVVGALPDQPNFNPKLELSKDAIAVLDWLQNKPILIQFKLHKQTMALCFRVLQLGKKNKSNPISLPPPLPPYFPSSSSGMTEVEIMEKKRWDSLESWSMLLDAGTSDNSDSNSGTRKEEWLADLSQLFIGNKFASGSNSRIYRGIYKQRAVAIKMVKIPDQDDKRRETLEREFNSEVAFLSQLYHPNIVQVKFECSFSIHFQLDKGVL
jgi:Protein tyrosine and serine/threonine kinase